jgi:signal transduction histidine kinase
MVETIEGQAARLERLTKRLLGMARLDRNEIEPRLRVTDVAAQVTGIVRQYWNQARERQFAIEMGEVAAEVLADPEILRLASRN